MGPVARLMVASVVMGAAAYYTNALLELWLPGHALPAQIVRLGSSIGVALIVLAAAAWLLHIREFNEGVALVTRRLRRTAR